MYLSRKVLIGLLSVAFSANSVLATDLAYDYIIVGLGTAGSVAARHLSDPDSTGVYKKVLVLEAGENYEQDPAVTGGPNQYAANGLELGINPKYAITTVVPENNFNPHVLGFLVTYDYIHGRGWGGTSSHNGMVATRGSSNYYDDLATSVGNNQWTYNNLLPFMMSLETFTGVSEHPELRGTSGPLQVSVIQPPQNILGGYPGILSNVTGSPIVNDYNVPSGNTSVIINQQDYSTPDGNSRSWAYNFLPTTILNPDGTSVGARQLTVKSGAFVNRVIFVGNVAVGLEYIDRDGLTQFAFGKNILLCAGCPWSAAILERSGIGDPTILSDPKIGIDVVVNQPLVGKGLKDHYGVITVQTQPSNPANQLQQPLLYWADGRNYYVPAGTGDNIRRILGTATPSLAVIPKSVQTNLGIDVSSPGIQGNLYIIQPKSTGTSHIVNKSPFVVPLMRFSPYSDGDLTNPSSDLSLAVANLKLAKGIADAVGSTMLYPPVSAYASDNLLAAAAGGDLNFTVLTYLAGHYAGTCNMGTDISTAVVSSQDLHVFGTQNLYVADNSVFPMPEAGHPAWTAYLIGLKLADILKNGAILEQIQEQEEQKHEEKTAPAA